MIPFHCVKSVRVRSFSGPYFPTFELNTERYSVPLRIQSEFGKMRNRKIPNTETFHAVFEFNKNILKTFLYIKHLRTAAST